MSDRKEVSDVVRGPGRPLVIRRGMSTSTRSVILFDKECLLIRECETVASKASSHPLWWSIITRNPLAAAKYVLPSNHIPTSLWALRHLLYHFDRMQISNIQSVRCYSRVLLSVTLVNIEAIRILLTRQRNHYLEPAKAKSKPVSKYNI